MRQIYEKVQVSKASQLDTLAHDDRCGCSNGQKQAQKALYSRAYHKYRTIVWAAQLADLKSPLEQSYRNSIYCANVIRQENGKLITKYCKNRWCQVCGRISTAKMINGYQEPLNSIENKGFLTLTVKNIPKSSLKEAIKLMQKVFAQALRVSRRNRRSEGSEPPIGLRTIEITHNKGTNEYHPHYHIVGDMKSLIEIRQFWIDHYPMVDSRFQVLKQYQENTIKELFKYITKLTKDESGVYMESAPAVMDVIYQHLRGKKKVSPYGNIKPVDEEFEDLEATIEAENDETRVWVWYTPIRSWYDKLTGELLTEPAFTEKPPDKTFVQ